MTENQNPDERNSRNIKAWGYDPTIMQEYTNDCADLDNGASPKQKLEEKLGAVMGMQAGSTGDKIKAARAYLRNIGRQIKDPKAALRRIMEERLGSLGGSRQEQIRKSRVAVVGSDALAQMVLACLAGIGVGNIYITDNQDVSSDYSGDFFCTHQPTHMMQPKIRHIAEALDEMNPDADMNIWTMYAKFEKAFVYQFNPEIIIEATNDPVSKKRALDYARETKTPVISISSNGYAGAIACYWPGNSRIQRRGPVPDLDALVHAEFAGVAQGGFASGIPAGLAAEEFRKFKFQYGPNDDNLPHNNRMITNIYSTSGKGLPGDLSKDRMGFYRDKRVLVAGCGAIGNFVALELALLGVGTIDVLDMDLVEDSNFARQPLLRGARDQKKCEVVAARLREIDEMVTSEAIYGKVGDTSILPEDIARKVANPANGETYADKLMLGLDEKRRKVEHITEKRLLARGYDIVFGCFDNKYARIWLNQFAVRNRVPYIDGGTNAYSGQLGVYIPGVTKCIDCQLDLMDFPERNSCVHDPSTIIPNIIIASQMVGSAIHAFNPGLNGSPIKGVYQFMPSSQARIYVRPVRGISGNSHGC